MTASGSEPKARQRSLKTALFEAGLGEAPPSGQHRVADDQRRAASLLAAVEVPRHAVFAAPRVSLFEKPSPAIEEPKTERSQGVVSAHSSVVSPPPWVRAARRGRWHAVMLNTFGWFVTLVVAGSIIGVAGRYLAVPPPPGLESFRSASQ